MRHSVSILALLGVCIATAAAAGVIVLGRGVGQQCYAETLITPSPSHNLRALQVCSKAVEDPNLDSRDRAAALVNRADILLRMQRFPQAVEDSEKSIAIDPQIGVAHLNRGAGLIGLKRHDEALASLNRAIDLGVDKLQLAYFDRGLAKEHMGDVRGAYLDYRKAAELDPAFLPASEQLGRFTVTTRARP